MAPRDPVKAAHMKELADLRAQLATAERERDDLCALLRETEAECNAAIVERDEARAHICAADERGMRATEERDAAQARAERLREALRQVLLACEEEPYDSQPARSVARVALEADDGGV